MSSPVQVAHKAMRQSFETGVTRPYEFRKKQLENVRRFLVEKEQLLAQALAADLHRGEFEAIGLEIMATVSEIDFILKNLQEWMKPTETPVPALFAPASSYITYEPYGVVLVIGAFNYPIVLTLSPMVGALAAGNCVVVKPSELSSATERILAEEMVKYLDPACVRVVCGDAKVTTELLSLRWDKIFFTGSTRVGKIVLQSAAPFLTPVSLELGGKSPTIVDQSVGDLSLAAKRIAWGKGVNAGQTCIAPDYLFVHERVYDAFISELKKQILAMYGTNTRQSKDFGRIISPVHYKRLKEHLDKNRGHIVHGGESEEGEKFIDLTLFADLPADSSLMSEELFGPLLPVLKFRDIGEVVRQVKEGEKPLTMYIFARDRKVIDRLMSEVSSGSVLLNDVLFNFANIHAPFGGVGHSGMGGYRGRFSFECFSHRRSVLDRNDVSLLDAPVRYPPYTPFALSFFRFGLTLPDVPPLGEVVRKGVVTLALVALGMVLAKAF